MKRLCFGALFSLMYQARSSNVTNYKLCSVIFSAFGGSEYFDSSLPGHLKSGRENVPPFIIEATQQSNIDKVYENFQMYVEPLIKECNKKSIVRAIKAILKEDNTIQNDFRIGYNDGYQKSNIIGCSTFTFSELLANVFYYSIISVKNTECKDCLPEMKDFLKTLDNSNEEIYFNTEDIEIFVPLKKTVSGNFGRIFSRVVNKTVSGLSNPSNLQIYKVNVSNYEFRFNDLKEYIIDNIGTYVYSRSNINRLEQDGKSHSIAYRALNLFVKNYTNKADGIDNVLGEMLLYLFLEQELNAPKIMSKIEIDTSNGGIISKSDGVHLLTTGNASELFHQLVFGASKIVGDLHQAVDRAFEKINEITDNCDSELQMVENSIYNHIFDDDTSRYMASVLIPQKGVSEKPDMSFGVFLGYTLNISHEGMNNIEFRNAVQEQLKADIEKTEPYICDKIKEYGLEGYSFYFYILPFNDAPSERKSIISEMIPGGN